MLFITWKYSNFSSVAYYVKDLKASKLFCHKGLYLIYTYYLHPSYLCIYNIFFFSLDKQLKLFFYKMGIGKSYPAGVLLWKRTHTIWLNMSYHFSVPFLSQPLTRTYLPRFQAHPFLLVYTSLAAFNGSPVFLGFQHI